MNKETLAKILLVLVLLIAVYFGYRTYQNLVTSGTAQGPTGGSGATAAGQEVLATMRSVEQIELEGKSEVLSSSEFQSLLDTSADIIPDTREASIGEGVSAQQGGRPNPFAAIGQDDPEALEALNAQTPSEDEQAIQQQEASVEETEEENEDVGGGQAGSDSQNSGSNANEDAFGSESSQPSDSNEQ